MKTYAFTTTGGSTVDPAAAVVNGVASVDINLSVTEDGHSQSFMWARAGQAVSAGRLAEARQVALGSTALLTGTLTTTLDTVQASAHATRYLPAGATTGTVRGAQNLGTDTVTIAPQGADTIDGGTAPYQLDPGKVIRLQSDGAGAWVEYASSGSGAAAVPDGSVTLAKLATDVKGTYAQRAAGTSITAAPLPFVNVRDFGADPTFAADSTSAFQNAVAALPSGGVLYVPTGTYRLTGKVTIAKPIVVQGDLRGVDGAALASVIITPAAVTGNLFEVTADNASFRDLNITNYGDQTSTNTAQSIAICFVSGRSQSVERCRISNFYINVDWQNCDWWRMAGNVITKASQYGVRIRNIALPDSGDSFFTDNFVVGAASAPWNTVALIRQESGGGTKFTNNKIIGGQSGYQLAVPDGIGTSVSLFTNNSFEGQTVSAVDVLHQGPSNTGGWARISFVGNEFLANLCTQSAFRVRPSVAGLIQQLSVIGNTFSGASGVSTIDIDNASEVTVSDNYINGGTNGIFLGSGTRGWYVRDNHISGVSTSFIKNAAYFQWQWSDNSMCDLERSKYIFNTSTTVPTAAVAIGMPNATACLVEVIFSGQVQGGSSPGACGGYFQRMLTQATNGGTPTITTVGTDTTTGQPFTTTFTTSGNSVVVNVGRSASDGGATDVTGTCFIRVRGAAYAI